MKKHFTVLFDSSHRMWTISFFTTAILLIIGAQITGITDNLPGILMLLSGIILMFFAFLHPWRNKKNYAILIAVCMGILILEWFGIQILNRINKAEFISEGIAMTVAFLVCIPGIMAGIIGIIFLLIKNRH